MPPTIKHQPKCQAGQVYGKLTLIESKSIFIQKRGRKTPTECTSWKCRCECGKELDVEEKGILYVKFPTCGCIKVQNCIKANEQRHINRQMFEEITVEYFNQTAKGSYRRLLEFSITIEDMWEQYIKQNRKCSLSGVEIYFKKKNSDDQTASIDRIDPTLGYTKENIQWIHKHINKMKMDLHQDIFIQYCKLITEYNNANFMV